MKIPKYRRHSTRNLGFVEFNKKRTYFPGVFNSSESLVAYAGFLKTLETDTKDNKTDTEHETGKVPILFLVVKYLDWAKKRYPKVTYEKKKHYAQSLVEFYPDLPVEKFGPLILQKIRTKFLKVKLCRGTINERISGIRLIFKWGVSMELVHETTYNALMTVSMLREGEESAFDYPPITEAPLEDVLKTIAVCHKTLGDMIRIQLLSAMRPKEVRLMRLCEIDTTDDIWIYAPLEHKTKHKGKLRTIPILPESQLILAPYIEENKNNPEAYLFSPKQALQKIALEKRAKRKSKVQPSQQGRRKGRRKGKPIGDCYTKDSYGVAIDRAAKRADVPKWSPNQLRHTKATDVDSKLGIEAAQILLGHSSPETTKIYLDPDVKKKEQIEKVKEVARKMV